MAVNLRPPDPSWAVGVGIVIASYWLLDALLRRGHWPRALARVGLASPRAAAGAWIATVILASPTLRWQNVDESLALRTLAATLCLPLAWSATTRDLEPGQPGGLLLGRLLLALSALAAPLSPVCLLISGYLLSGPLCNWQHHATLPMRLLLALMSFVAANAITSSLGWPLPASALIFFAIVIQVSHYFITALAKGLLGPRWYSWVTENRLHYLAASAYSWGWARFLPFRTWSSVIGGLKRIRLPLQAGAFAIELLAPLALLDRGLCQALCLGWAAFHAGVFAVSGLLFWEWIAVDCGVVLVLARLSPEATRATFGPWPTALGLALLVALPLRHKLWRPMPLGWFDSPFTQRITWRVTGRSGKVYGLYNDFMCPHDRLYGKVHGCFLAPVPVLTYHLGEVWKLELRDAIVASRGKPERLDEVRRRYGIVPRSPDLVARHEAYLRRFFRHLNAGAKKHVLPPALRFLKAPGGQIYYWGDLPAYRGQEPVHLVTLHYREELFDGKELVRLREQQVLEVDVDEGPMPEVASEPTPKELDDFLLGYAAGRLIDLPGFGGGYVQADDGRASPRDGQAA